MTQKTETATRNCALRRQARRKRLDARGDGFHPATAPPATLTARFVTITPMLTAGADGKTAELRCSSIMAAIRFWWRALAWSRILRALPDGNEAERLHLLHHWHSELFGAEAGTRRQDDDKRFYGCGRISARVSCAEFELAKVEGKRGYSDDDLKFSCRTKADRKKIGLNYCAGQGLDRSRDEKNREKPERTAVPPGTEIVLEIVVRGPDAEKQTKTPFDMACDQPPTLAEAIWTFALLGAVGARSRRGFGSMQLQSRVGHKEFPREPKQFAVEVEELLAHCDTGKEPVLSSLPYTALSFHSEFALWKDPAFCTTAAQAHHAAGREFLLYRGNGRKGKHEDLDAKGERFVDDARRFKALAGCLAKGKKLKQDFVFQAPKRMIFGLPHNYSYGEMYERRTGVFAFNRIYDMSIPTGTCEIRRASPLFLKIVELAGKYRALWLFIPARFLPYEVEHVPGWAGQAKWGNPKGAAVDVGVPSDWAPITDFIASLKASGPS